MPVPNTAPRHMRDTMLLQTRNTVTALSLAQDYHKYCDSTITSTRQHHHYDYHTVVCHCRDHATEQSGYLLVATFLAPKLA